ncbi:MULTISPECIES: hypothetical protein [Alphaproteobacteria]|uniref:Uncharacterized protein n=2 Tax=Alphaproteobacteria TaxID=28211 RepID=A0A512HG28_9HYPH|nr:MULTISPECIES: hypothetical protein [Alphaproteobacteria]GEO84340.1 hypothetical protein RNA01_12720 [Ciceribacter naphthalenivorans]GLR24877.1 hypothetical protein GCM10007920_46710 [Ciceribacter naphthalenivorans]GLT07733.1 hypothetical protein GCM10007926_46710 [Sphingomonas psychrolutea]
MAEIIRIKDRLSPIARTGRCDGAVAKVLLFTGIRYERRDPAEARLPALPRPKGGKR